MASARAAMVWNLGATGKLCWPIPDRGLHKRLHRVTAPTLIVWGEQDTLISPVYAEEFRTRIADSRVAIIPGSGHTPQLEQTEATYGVVSEFLS
jgi:pimeloyl-ACP methyl ester carboxylesterase